MLSWQHLVHGTHARVLNDLLVRTVGIIADVSNNIATLWFSEDKSFQAFAVDSLVLQFEHDDHVTVICGEHKEYHRLVISICDGDLTGP